MSDEQPTDATNAPKEPSDALTGEVRTSVLVPRESGGGALHSGGRHPKLTNPTASDVAANATRYLYRELPRLRRIAHNEQQRPKPKAKGKTGKPAKTPARTRGRREFTVEQQLRAFTVLSEIAKLDRTVRAAAVDEFIAGIIDDVRSYLPKDSADALLSMFKHRARRI